VLIMSVVSIRLVVIMLVSLCRLCRNLVLLKIFICILKWLLVMVFMVWLMCFGSFLMNFLVFMSFDIRLVGDMFMLVCIVLVVCCCNVF